MGADGLRSRVRRLAGLEGRRGARRRYGAGQHFEIRPWSPFVEVHWGSGVEAYLTPVAPDRVGVALLFDAADAPPRPAGSQLVSTLLSRFPALAERFRDAEACDAPRATGPLAQGTLGVARDRLVLVGDASGYLDAITGEGLSLAFEEALALGEIVPPLLAANRLRRADLAPYVAAHRRITAPYYRFTGLVLTLGRFPPLVERVVAMLGRDPDLFSTFLDVNMGRVGLAEIGPRTWARALGGLVAIRPR